MVAVLNLSIHYIFEDDQFESRKSELPVQKDKWEACSANPSSKYCPFQLIVLNNCQVPPAQFLTQKWSVSNDFFFFFDFVDLELFLQVPAREFVLLNLMVKSDQVESRSSRSSSEAFPFLFLTQQSSDSS